MLALEKFSRAEKLRMMEALWRDLSSNSEVLQSPDWHADALRDAEAAVADGSAQMIDWDEAKALLRRRTRP